MVHIFRRRWFWIASFFAVVNISGLSIIASLVRPSTPALRIESFAPQGEIDPASALRSGMTIRFNQPMVVDREIGTVVAQPNVAFVPPIRGNFTWNDSTTLRFSPSEPFRPATRYQAIVSRNITSLIGNRFASDGIFEFSTPGLSVTGIHQTDLTNSGAATLALSFNDEVAPAELRGHLTLTSSEGKNLGYAIRNANPSRLHSIVTDPVSTTSFTVKVSKGLCGTGGAIGTVADVESVVRLDRTFAIHGIGAYTDDSSAHITVGCSRDVNIADARHFVRVDPPVDFTMEDRYDGFILRGNFIPSRMYRVTLFKGLPAMHGGELREDVVRSVLIPDRSPALSFKTRGIYLSSRGNLLIPMETVNLTSVDLFVEKIFGNNLVYYLAGGRSSNLGAGVLTKNITIDSTFNQARTTHIDLKNLLDKNTVGVFLLTARDTQDGWMAAQQLVLLTDIGITTKKTAGEMLVWTNAISTARALEGVNVAVYTRTNQKILEGTTGPDGVVRFREIAWNNENKPFAVVATTGADTAALQLSQGVVDVSSFDVGGREFLARGYESFLFTDRGVYRPGEKVHLKALVRSAGPGLPERFPLTFVVTRPDGVALLSRSIMLSDLGSAETEIALPSYALTGRYRADVRLPGNAKTVGTVAFDVEEFVPNRMSVAIDGGADRRYRKGEKITFTVKGNYLFGAPAAGRIVEARCEFVAADYSHDRYREFRFADGSKKFSAVRLDLGSGELDEKGEKSFVVDLPDHLTPPSALTLLFTASVKEVGGRAVTASVSRAIDYYPSYVGLSNATGTYGEAGKPSRFLCAVVHADGTPVPDGKAEATFYRILWHSVLRSERGGRYRYESQREEKEIERQTVAVAAGSGSFSFTPKEPGEYEIRIRAVDEGVSANLSFHCAGAGHVPWALEKPEVVELVADKPCYAPGETARIMLKSPFAGKALVTVESTRIHHTAIVEIGQNAAECLVPIVADGGSNLYCSATVIRGTTTAADGTSHRAFGVIPLKIDAEPGRLRVTIDAAETARPGATVPIKVYVRDSRDAGTRAEITIAAVDEGICRLTGFATPDPWAFFFAKRKLGTETSDVYSLLMPELDNHQPGSKPTEGGDGNEYDPRLLNPISVERFKPVAVWKSSIVTGDDGWAEAEIAVPTEFTGRLRLMVVASTASAFGNGERALLVKQPLMIQASFPRFLSPGDEFDVPIVIFNNTGRSGVVRVRAEGSIDLALLSAAEQVVEIGDGREAVVRMKARAPEIPGAVAVGVTAELGGETASEKVAIAVRPPATLRHLSGSGTVAAGATARLVLPDQWVEGSEKYALSFSSLPLLRLGDSMRYLLQYPYGCVEQTTSKAFPLLYLDDLLKITDPEHGVDRAAAPFVQSAIDRLLSMQTGSGGFAMWPGYPDVYPWGSVYATHFLVEAKRAGHIVPSDALENALRFLDTSLAMLGDDEGNLPIKAYACMTLAAAGKPNHSWTRRLYEERERLPAYSRFHVVAALSLTQSARLVSAFMAGERIPDETSRADTGGVLHSSTREAAILLSVYLDIDPSHPNIPILVKRLEDAARDGRWATTQENGMALMAMGKYLRMCKPRETDYRAVVLADGRELAVFTSRENIRLTPRGIGGKKIEIAIVGKGNLYYHWGVEGIPLKAEIPESDNGVKIRRTFFTRKGEPLDLRSVPHGEPVVVSLSITNDVVCDNMAISDLLPAGFEIENPRIATSETLPWLTADGFVPERVEMRDDRLLIFADLRTVGTRNFRYLARAVTRGRFDLPPVSGFCMYRPEISSVHGKGTVEIR